jgi:uncharacterized protein
MRILVDADACPVKEIIVRIAKSCGIPVVMFIDTSHELCDGYSEIVTVDKARDSADFALIARAKAGDIVVTQDFGVAAMALAVGAAAVNQNGLIFNDGNMDSLLFERHISQKIRRGGGRTANHPPRSKEDDLKFISALTSLIDASYSISP